MMQHEYRLETTDCTPFDGNSFDRLASIQRDLSAPCLLSFREANEDRSTDQEPIVWYDNISRKWWAGRYVGYCQGENYSLTIYPRFGEKALMRMIEVISEHQDHPVQVRGTKRGSVATFYQTNHCSSVGS